MSCVLLHDGVLAHIVATLGGVNNVEDDERRIVDQFMSLLQRISDECKEQLFDEVLQRIDELRNRDVAVIAVQKKIALEYFAYVRRCTVSNISANRTPAESSNIYCKNFSSHH